MTGGGVSFRTPPYVIPNRSEESKIRPHGGLFRATDSPLRGILDSSSCAPRNDSGGGAPRNDSGRGAPRNDSGRGAPRNDSGGGAPRNDSGGRCSSDARCRMPPSPPARILRRARLRMTGGGVSFRTPPYVIPNRSEESKIPATWGTLPSNGLPSKGHLRFLVVRSSE